MKNKISQEIENMVQIFSQIKSKREEYEQNMLSQINDIVIKMKLPVDVKYDSEKRLKWRLQKAIDLTRQEMLGLIRSYEQNKRLNYES